MDERPYPEGIDSCWLASDRDGQLGAFVTGGNGPIPALALLPDYPLDDIEERVLALTKATDVELLIKMPRPDSFVDLAERGLFVYDWSDVHRVARAYIGEYELMARPYRPLTLDLLPDALSGVARSVRFTDVSFASAWRIDVRAHLACRDRAS